jgi:beta-galactosidase
MMVLGTNAMAQRTTTPLNFAWEFSRDSAFTTTAIVDIPHDFQISQPWVTPADDEKADNSNAAANIKSRLSGRGFKEMGCGWYRKLVKVNGEELKGRRMLLDFEGIMLVGDVYLNGRHIGKTDYGYVGFEVDVTGKLKAGDNIVVVKASTMAERNSRWYTGGGLIRNVSLVSTPADLYFDRHPLYITTRDNQTVSIQASFVNNKDRLTRYSLSIYSPDGQRVYEGCDSIMRYTPRKIKTITMREVTIPHALVWDTDHPHLYRAEVRLLRQDGSVADITTEHFGFRKIEIGPDYGLRLNGRKVLLKGFANHHTLGALGAAAYPRAIEKRLRLMKDFGVNHVRTSHNPYSRDFIRLCDRLGLLVVDELYDKWTQQNSGGRTAFTDHWLGDVEEWVKRDRNSPSVVMWSLGNELQQLADQPFNDFGVTCYKMMRTLVQRYDTTRLTTVAMHPRFRNWQTDSLPSDLALHTDVQSYNYRYKYFATDGHRYPWMTFYQSEATTKEMGQNFFGMNLDKVIGLAYWGVIDYLGESQGWPAKGWDNGVFDISLEPKPKAYLMKSLFSEAPTVHIAIEEDGGGEVMWNGVKTGHQAQSESWNRTKDSKVTLYTYTNCDEVELLLNGKSLGKKKNPADAAHRNQVRWTDIPYERGRLQAVGYQAGKAVATHHIETTGKATKLVVTADPQTWQADGQDLQHLRITAVDSKGRRVWDCHDEVSVSVDGDARIMAVGNGNIYGDDISTGKTCHLHHGTALVILRSACQPSKVVVSTTSPSLKSATTRLETR